MLNNTLVLVLRRTLQMIK